jgi:hypothetical protein
MLYLFVVIVYKTDKVHSLIYSNHQLSSELIEFIPNNLYNNSNWDGSVKQKLLFGVFSLDVILKRGSKLLQARYDGLIEHANSKLIKNDKSYKLSNNTKRVIKYILSKDVKEYSPLIIASETFSDNDEEDSIIVRELGCELNLIDMIEPDPPSESETLTKTSPKIISNSSDGQSTMKVDQLISRELNEQKQNITSNKLMSQTILDNPIMNDTSNNYSMKSDEELFNDVIHKFDLKPSWYPKKNRILDRNILLNMMTHKEIFETNIKDLRKLFKVSMIYPAIYRITY